MQTPKDAFRTPGDVSALHVVERKVDRVDDKVEEALVLIELNDERLRKRCFDLEQSNMLIRAITGVLAGLLIILIVLVLTIGIK